MKLSKSLKPQLYPVQLEERVLQFGTGVLLRGLCDFFIDNANKKGVFNGSIVIVKSTGTDIDDFVSQDNYFTVCTKGINKGVIINESSINGSISRVLTAQNQWDQILETARNPKLDIVVSNTTEVGIQYIEESIFEGVPSSFPAKLTAWLLERYNSNKNKVVVIPTELIVDNGKILKNIVLQVAGFNKLEKGFLDWLHSNVTFASSLVDRIVPGKPKGEELSAINKDLGYEDDLLIVAECYSLWAIEGSDELEEVLSFVETEKGVVIDKNIEKYRELKLRLLNAPHSLMCGMAYLSGFETVKEALNDELFEKYFTILMLTELAPSIPFEIDTKIAQRYGRDVMDRFRNPFLNHQWLSITFQYTLKLKSRTIPLLLNYYEVFHTVPQYFARCFSAYLLFMKSVKEEGGVYYGQRDKLFYPITCDSAAYFHELWKNDNIHEIVNTVLSSEELWGSDLTKLEGFEKNVDIHLSNMMMAGVKEVASALNVYA
jgi:tagaturonate reductase